LSKVLEALVDAGLPPPLVTGGGTGSHAIDAELGVLTEIQPGSYVFMDRQVTC
jgi:D-serine deaminase-like pyridoxal phosphate-dependent protein